jgi:ribosomal protein S18 acetylase RimI-like enzyme
MTRLEAMTEEDFQESLERSIQRHATEYARRGLWTEDAALEASRLGFALLLPQGRATPHRRFCNVIEETLGSRVGETWYTVEEKGGKVQFWMDWILIDPPHRRRGHATRVLGLLEEEALRLGADRTGLSVWVDNPGAVALYAKLGYVATNMRMMKPIGRPR